MSPSGCEWVRNRVLGTGPGQSGCDSRFGEARGVQDNTPSPGNLGDIHVHAEDRGARMPALQIPTLGAGLPCGIQNGKGKVKGRGQQAEGGPPQGPTAAFLQLLPRRPRPARPSAAGPHRRWEGREACLAVRQWDAGAPSPGLTPGP